MSSDVDAMITTLRVVLREVERQTSALKFRLSRRNHWSASAAAIVQV